MDLKVETDMGLCAKMYYFTDANLCIAEIQLLFIYKNVYYLHGNIMKLMENIMKLMENI